MYGPTTELSERVIDAIAQAAAAELNRVAQAVPASPAAVLGRLGQPQPEFDRRSGRGRMWQYQAVRPAVPQHGSAAKAGLAEVPQLVAERVLGALELTVAALELPVPQLVEALPEASGGPRMVAIASLGGESEMSVELSKLDAFVPGGTDMVAHVVAAVAGHPSIAPLLTDADAHADACSGAGSDEAAIAAAHGARHLALAVVVATIVLRPLWPAITPSAVIGAALGVAAPILREAPMPAGYAEAVLARRREEYLMPRSCRVQADVKDHVIALTEGPLESAVDFSQNGLVAVLPHGIAVRSGLESGSVPVGLRVLKEAPELDVTVWDEVVDTSWHAPAGGAAFAGGDPTQITPPWPGDYRVRVSARGRDGEREPEHYDFAVWSAPAADPVVHKRSDRLGHVLRGEPEPPRIVTPEEVYHWVESSSLSQAATVTFVAGKSSYEVLRAFGADESAPTPLGEFYERDYQNTDPWVCVLDVAGGTVAVEFNGFEGSNVPVLRALSSPGNAAASMYWNVNALRRFSLARNGNVLAGFELGLEDTTCPQALELLTGLDVKGPHRNAVGLLAANRFTGVWLSAEDLARIEAVGIGYPILPLLPELYPMPRPSDGFHHFPGHGPLGTDTDRLLTVPDEELRDLAWWAAAFAAAHSELSEHPAVTASLAARALTPEAEMSTRRSHLHEHSKHRWLWTTLHAATNPDPLGAAFQALDSARFAVAGHAAELLDQARARLG